MQNPKRLIIATIFGVVFGFVCWILSSSGGPTSLHMMLQIIISRTLIGFTIGISNLRLKWWLHGLIIGFLFSLPIAFNGFFVVGREVFIFMGTMIMGTIYGFLIELFTSVVFKAPAE